MRRFSALFVMVAMLAAAVTVWHPGHAAAAGALRGQPSVTGVSPQVGAPGDTITVAGSGFQTLLCTTTLTVGGVTPSHTSVVNDGTMTFTAQDGMHGGIQVAESGLGGTNFSNINVAFYTPPTVTGFGPSAPKVGDAVTVSGHGFAFSVPSGYEHVSATYPGGCAGPSASFSDTAITLSPPGSFCTGAVGLTITAPGNLGDPSSQIPVYNRSPGSIDVQASGVGLSSPSATAGGPVTINGSGLGTSGSATIGGAPANVASWTNSAVTLTVPDTAVSNSPVALTRGGDNANIAAGTLGVVAHIDSLSPSTASAGDTVTIAGGGFGVNAGTVTLGSTNIPVSSWSPTAITVKIPTGSQSGNIAVLPKDTSPPANSLALKVNLPPINIGGGTGSPGASGSAGASGSSAKPLTPDQVQQVASALSAPPAALPAPQVGGPTPSLPPSHPTNGPVAMSLKTGATTALPGKSVPFTVTLKAYGQPVANAAVQMVIAYEPGSDGTVTPSSGITDAKGQFKGTVHLSKSAGEMIILARAGEFSDEVRLVGSTAAATAHVGGGSSAILNYLPIGIVVLASLLVLTGAGIRLWLAFGSSDRVSTALFFKRVRKSGAGARLRTRLGNEAPSGNSDHAGGNAPPEVEAPGQVQAAVVLHAADGDPAPNESKERIEVHS
ncbi:MAG: IPT/TIG domain-containing protein [Candidatus Dormibacteria bacterium]